MTRDDLKASGVFTGTIAALTKSKHLEVEGDAKLAELSATGTALSGDEVRLDSVTLGLKLDQADRVWTADRLDVATSVGNLSAKGSYPLARDRGSRVEGNLDLAALAGQIPRTLRLRKDLHVEKGTLTFQAEINGQADQSGQTINVKAGLSDLAARRGSQSLSFRDPATLAALLHRRSDGITLEQLDITTPFLTATGRGDLDRGVNVLAQVDLDALSKRLHEWLETGGLALAGQGKIDARYQRVEGRFETTASAEFKGLAATGLPGIESLRRDKLIASLKAKGGCSPAGLPASLQELSLTARGDGEELNVTASGDQATGVNSARLKGRVEHLLRGSRQNTELTIGAAWNDKELTLAPIELASTPVVGPGGRFLPSEPRAGRARGNTTSPPTSSRSSPPMPAPASTPTHWRSRPRGFERGDFRAAMQPGSRRASGVIWHGQIWAPAPDRSSLPESWTARSKAGRSRRAGMSLCGSAFMIWRQKAPRAIAGFWPRMPRPAFVPGSPASSNGSISPNSRSSPRMDGSTARAKSPN